MLERDLRECGAAGVANRCLHQKSNLCRPRLEGKSPNHMPEFGIVREVKGEASVDSRDAQVHAVTVNKNRVAVIRCAFGHDADHHRVLVGGILEAEFCPTGFGLVNHQHASIERAAKIHGDSSGKHEILVVPEHQHRRVEAFVARERVNEQIGFCASRGG